MSRHEHGDCRMALRRRGADRRRLHRPRAGHRRLPHAVAGGHGGRGRDAVPRALPGAGGAASAPRRCSRTPPGGRPTGARGSSSPWPARCCSTSRARRMGMDPVELRRRNLLRQDELPYANPNGMPYSDITPSETFEQALAILDLDAFRSEQAEARAAGRYLGVGTSTYVEPTTTGMAFYGTEGATIRIEPSGKVNVYVAGGSTGNSLETAVVQLTADALGVDIADVRTIQGDTAVTPFGAGTGGSRSGSMIAGAVEETAAVLRERLIAIAAHRLEAAPDDIVLDGQPGLRAGDAERRVSRWPRSPTSPTSRPGELPEGVPAGLEASGRYHARSPMIWANATHVCTCEVDVDDGRGDAPALHRQRGLRPDDQPERRRGPDRRGDRPGHRRRAPRAPRLRRGRQPAHHDVHGLPAAHRGRRTHDRVRARRDHGPRARRLQGRRRGRRHRRPAGRRERRRRRAGAPRRRDHPAAPHPRGDRRPARWAAR